MRVDARALVTLAGSLIAFVAVYSTLRVVEVLFSSEVNPALVMWTTPIALFWRSLIAFHAALLCAPALWAVATRDPTRSLAVLMRVAPWVGLWLVTQAVLAP